MRENSGKLRAKVGGFGLVFLVATMVPIVVMVAAAATAMSARSARLKSQIKNEKAMQAAEAGIDIAIYQANLGILQSGSSIEHDLGSNLHCSIEALNVYADGQDNDGDGEIDEADENVYQLTVRGSYTNTCRRLRAYIRINRMWHFDAAVIVLNPNIQIELDGDPVAGFHGQDRNIDGSPGPSAAVPGLSIEPPGSRDDLAAQLETADEASRVTGAGGSPSVAVRSTSLDTAALIAGVRGNADVNLGAQYDNVTEFDFGDASANDWRLLYREGDLQISKKGCGAGIWVVTGKLQVDDHFRFDGILIVEGDLQFQKDVEIHGSVIHAGNRIRIADRCRIHYSSEAVNGAIGALSPTSVYPFGWWEISR